MRLHMDMGSRIWCACDERRCVCWARVCRRVGLSRLAVGLPPLNSPHEALSIWSLDFPLTNKHDYNKGIMNSDFEKIDYKGTAFFLVYFY